MDFTMSGPEGKPAALGSPAVPDGKVVLGIMVAFISHKHKSSSCPSKKYISKSINNSIYNSKLLHP
jgi:hypothetical protein